MSQSKPPMPSIGRNVLFQAAMTGTNLLFPLLTLPYITRVLGPESLGRVNLAAANTSFFLYFASMGLGFYAVREIARVRDDRAALDRVFSEIFVVSSLGCLLSLLVFLGLWFWAPPFSQDRWLYGILGLQLVFQFLSPPEWLFQGLESFGWIAVRNMVLRVLSLAALFALVREERHALYYAGILAGTQILSVLWNFVQAMKRVRLYWPGMSWARHLAPLPIFFLVQVASATLAFMDKSLVGHWAGHAAAGFYSAADRVLQLGLTLASSLTAVLAPRLSWLAGKSDPGDFDFQVVRALKFILALGLLMIGGGYWLLPWLTPLAFGSNFAPAAAPMVILLLQIPLLGWIQIAGGQVLVALGREKGWLGAQISGASALLVLLFWAVPRWGLTGAAWGGVGASLVQWAVLGTLLRAGWRRWFHPVHFLPYLVAAGGFALITFSVHGFLPRTPAMLMGAVAVASCAYVILLRLQGEYWTGMLWQKIRKFALRSD